MAPACSFPSSGLDFVVLIGGFDEGSNSGEGDNSIRSGPSNQIPR